MKLKAFIPDDSSKDDEQEVQAEVVVQDTIDSDEIPESFSNEPIVDMEEERYWAEVRLAGSMADVERKRIELEERIQESKQVVSESEADLRSKEASHHALKEEFNACTDRLLLLARKLVELADGKDLPTLEQEIEEDTELGWRLAMTAELLKGIKGLSQKKLEKLVDQAPTLGELEDLRALASTQHKSFHEVLPKGIGGAVAAAIEDTMTEYVYQWSQKVKDPARIKLADDLLAECRQLVLEWNAADCVPQEPDDEHQHAGFTAFGEGLPHTEFISDDRAKAKLWMTGWVAGEHLAGLKAAEQVG